LAKKNEITHPIDGYATAISDGNVAIEKLHIILKLLGFNCTPHPAFVV